MRVNALMHSPVIVVHKGWTYESVARLLYDHHISGAPVVDQEGKLIGMVSEKDLYRVLFPRFMSFVENPELYIDSEAREKKAADISEHKVETFMVSHVVTIDPYATVMHAGALMLAKRIHRLPVMDEGKLVGIVTRRDLFRAAIEQQLGL